MLISSGDFKIKHYVDKPNNEFLKFAQYTAPLIAYNEKRRVNDSLLDLLSDPFKFLFRPRPGLPTFQETHGADVFYAITYHCYLLATEEIRPLYRYMEPQRTVSKIMERNPNAKSTIESMLS